MTFRPRNRGSLSDHPVRQKVFHTEIADVAPAIRNLTNFLGDANWDDPVVPRAVCRLGLMLPVVGRSDEGLRCLDVLRSILAGHLMPLSTR